MKPHPSPWSIDDTTALRAKVERNREHPVNKITLSIFNLLQETNPPISTAMLALAQALGTIVGAKLRDAPSTELRDLLGPIVEEIVIREVRDAIKSTLATTDEQLAQYEAAFLEEDSNEQP